MNLIIKKTLHLKGQLTPPGSKSQGIRALILGALGHGKTVLENLSYSDDTQDAINVCRYLGSEISEFGTTVTIKSNGLPLKITHTDIYSGNSGITTCFVMPILGLRDNADQPIFLNCSDQMRTRPIKPLVDALAHLGLNISYLKNTNALPIRMSGSLIGGKTNVDGITSQYLSALLIALPCAQKNSEITVKNLQERSYVEMTLQCLKDHDIQFSHQITEGYDQYRIVGRQHYKNSYKTISSDFSSASYLIAAAVLIPGEVILQALDMTDRQGDKQLVSILQAMGANIVIEGHHLRIRGGEKLSGIKIDAQDIPDLLPTLAVLGTYASGKTEIYNVGHARIKETDRIHSMTDGLRRMNAKINEHTDGLTIYQSVLQGNHVKGYGDHRTVMALSVAGMIAHGTTLIEGSEAINKTFPNFVSNMQLLGANMEVEYANA